MPFYGQEDVSETPSEVDRPLRKYSFKTWGGKHKEVEASYVEFKAHHVAFWLDRSEPNVQDTLVLAEPSTNVAELREVLA